MPLRHTLAPSALLVLLACRGQTSMTAPPEASALPPAHATSASAAVPKPPVPNSAPATSRLAITNLEPGRFEIVNTGSDSMKVSTALRIERRDADGVWKALEGLDLRAGYRLIASCTDTGALPACSEIASQKTIVPVPWSGFSCSAQCNGSCRGNVWEGPGVFRLAVSDCDAHTIATGPSFELPGTDYASREAFARWRASNDIVRVTAARLTNQPKADLREAPQSNHIVGFEIRPGTERAVAASEVTKLRDALRDPRGYDDQILKRCAMGPLIGMRIVRSPATTGAAREITTELAFDMNCHKIFFTSDTAAPRTIEASHFDPSVPAFQAIARAIFPDDRALAPKSSAP